MQHVSFEAASCPIARALDRVGEWWSILVLREAFYGARRFDEFEKGLEGIAPTTLTKRLKELVAAGLLERQLYSERPARYEYHLTEAGRDFRPVLWMMLDWGSRHFCPEGELVRIENSRTRKRVTPVLVDRDSGRELAAGDFRLAAGAAASDAVRKKFEQLKQNP